MIQAYRILTTILYPFLFLFLFFRTIIKKEDPERFKEKIFISRFNIKKKDGSKLVWFHAASIGEFKSIIPIIEKLNAYKKNLKFLVTTTTLSSGKLATIELKNFDNVEHRYLPLDINFLMDKFIFLWQPDRIFLVDSEIWPNLILKAKKYNIPIAIINARITSKSFKRWMIFPNVAKKIFNTFKVIICSNEKTKKFFEEINIKNIYFKGNIKLIGNDDEKKIKNVNKELLLNTRFWFAASIHKDEEEFCLKTHLELKKKFSDILTIIAPRHIDRSKRIISLSDNLSLSSQILSKDEAILKGKEIIIINYFGALQKYFKYAKSTFLGKSIIKKLKNDSGQNPIEAAKLNCKIYHGPYVSNFEDIYRILHNYKISKKVENFKELSDSLAIDLGSINHRKEIFNPIKHLEQKTLNDTMILVKNFIDNENN